MIDRFEYKGLWYLPNNPKRRISGILKFSPEEGAILELIGTFQRAPEVKNDFLEPEIILGVTTDGKYLTLYKCIETHSPMFLSGRNLPSKSVFRATYVLDGVSVKRIEDLRLRGLGIEYAHLDEWANTNGFKIDIASDLKGAVVQYTLPSRIEAANLGTYKVFIDFRCKWPVRSLIQKEALIKQTVYVTIEPLTQMSFQELLSIEFRLTTFFGLAVMRAVGPLRITGWTKHKEVVEIYSQLVNTPIESGPLLPRDMLFTLSDTNGGLTIHLENWLRKAAKLAPIYSLYFATVYSSRIYLEHKFLSLAQAIESYHRRCKGNTVLPKAEHRRRIKRIINAVPEDKEWLQQRLAYSNEPTLRNRLQELCNEHSVVLKSVLPDIESFIRRVIDTRNYLTHYDERLKEKQAEGRQLFMLAQKLKMLLELCLLKELGFEDSALQGLVERNRRYQAEASITL
jgi:hypothetical protein